MKKVAPKRKKMAVGGYATSYDLSGLTADQIAHMNSLQDPAAKDAYYNFIKAQIAKSGTGQKIATAGNALDKTGNKINVDTTLNNGVDAAAGQVDDGTGAADAAKSGSGVNAGAAIGMGTDILTKAIPQDTETGRYASKIGERAGQGFAVAGPWGAVGGAVIGGVEQLFAENSRKEAIRGAKQKKAIDAMGARQDVVGAAKGGYIQKKAKGGQVVGPGGPTDDLIETNLPEKSFVVPAKNAAMAQKIREQYLATGGTVKPGAKSGVPVALSNGEHVFTAEEMGALKKKGVNIEWLAPEASDSYMKRCGGKVYMRKGGSVEKKKAKKSQPFEKERSGIVQKLAAGGGVEKQFDLDKFAKDVLAKLSIPANEKTIAAFKRWAKEEGNTGGRGFNPLNTTWKKDKATTFNSHGVKNYSSYEDGVEATADTLALPAYKEVVKAFSTGDENAVMESVYKSPWGTKSNGPRLANFDDDAAALDMSGGSPFDKKQPKGTYWEKYGLDPKDFDKDYVNYVNDLWAKQPKATPETMESAMANDPNWKKNADGSYTQTTPDGLTPELIDDLRQRQSGIAGLLSADDQVPDEPAPTPGIRGNGDDILRQQLDEQAGVGSITMEQPAADAGAGSKKDADANTFDKLGGWGGLLGLGQTAFGLANLASIGHRPEDKVDAVLERRRDEAIADRWLNPAVKANAEQQIELDRREAVKMAESRSGGDVGAGTAGAMQAQVNAGRARLGLAALEEQELAGKNARADSLTKDVAAAKRRLFEDNLHGFEQNQKGTADLINAGISNFVGAVNYKDQLKQMRERDQMYANSNVSVPSNPNAVTEDTDEFYKKKGFSFNPKTGKPI